MGNDVQDHVVGSARTRRPKFWPLTIATAIAFVFLVSLGVWQLQRLEWKQGLIDEIEVRQTAEPVSLTEALDMRRAGEDIEYLRVVVTGTFKHAYERYFYAPDASVGPGVEVFTPFELASGHGVILVNRGFVPERAKAVANRARGQVTGAQEIEGLVRVSGRKGAFTPDNNPKENLWFWRDFDAMMEGVPGPSVNGPALRLFIDAEEAAPGGWPRGGVRKIELSNRHFGYALTWFGLALTLLGVYGALIWGRRAKRGPT